MNTGIIVAAGKSSRVGPGVDKAFLSLGTRPVLAYSVRAFERCPDIDSVILVVRKDHLESARNMVQLYGYSKIDKVIAGGAKRQVSVSKGLAELNDDVKLVTVHDGARPCIEPELISETIKVAKRCGSAVAAVKVTDTVKHVNRGTVISKTVDRSKLWAVQTPQTFKVDLLKKAFEKVRKKGLTVTDEASAVELVSKNVRLIPASISNIKITTADDLALAAALMKL